MAKQPKAYTAPHKVYTGGVLYNPGETFVTDAEPGAEWQEVAAQGVEKKAAEAANPLDHSDVNLEEMTVDALKGHAATLGVDVTGLSKKADIITVIRAADDPTR